MNLIINNLIEGRTICALFCLLWVLVGSIPTASIKHIFYMLFFAYLEKII